MLVSLYEDYRDGIVDKSDFAIIKESFEVKKARGGKGNRQVAEGSGKHCCRD